MREFSNTWCGLYPGLAATEIDRLRALNKKLVEVLNECADDLAAEIDRLRALNKKLVEVLNECADDLAAEIENRYNNSLNYPSMRVRYDRDMEPVLKARAAIAKAEGRTK